MIKLFIVSFLSIIFFFVNSSEARHKQDIDQLELQEELQRFYTRFTERVVAALGNKTILESSKLSQRALAQYLLYDSEALKIVTSPFPEVNLMDMMVFIKLNELTVRDVWKKEFGKSGLLLYNAFKVSEKEINEIAGKLLDKDQISHINGIVLDWKHHYPHQTRTEKIRIADFSQMASKAQMQQEKSGFSLSSIIVDTKGAVKAVDQMVLVANRAIFLAQQLPFIMRLQVRLGAIEVYTDLSRELSNDKPGNQMKTARTMIGDVKELTKEFDKVIDDSHSLFSQIKNVFPDGINVNRGLKDFNTSLDKGQTLLSQFQKDWQSSDDMIKKIRSELTQMIFFIAFVFIVVGASLAGFWWLGFYFVKKRLGKSGQSL